MGWSGMMEGDVLVVDDDSAVRRVLDEVLSAGGYRVYQAGDGLQARALIEHRDFDTVVLDLLMPGGDGLGLCGDIRAREQGRYTPIVFLTAANDAQLRRRARQIGADDFLSKPFDPLELLARIRNTVRVKHGFDRLSRERNQMREAYELQRRALEDAVRKLHHVRTELMHAQQETLARLNRAAEVRDDETAAHLQRMSRYCRLLGERVGLPGEVCEMLQAASPMHDVGKIGIPDHILLKPGKLTRDEFEIMKQHAEIGYRILADSNSPLLSMAARIARTHHEKWDGSGYPCGLRGAQIPIEGRIATIADVFDALTSARPYKNAWSVEDALSLLRRERAKHFDPDLVELFFGAIEEVEAIRHRFAEAPGTGTPP